MEQNGFFSGRLIDKFKKEIFEPHSTTISDGIICLITCIFLLTLNFNISFNEAVTALSLALSYSYL